MRATTADKFIIVTNVRRLSMDWITRLDSPVGELTLASDGNALTGLWIAGQKYHSLGLEPGAREARLPVFEAAAGWRDS